MDKTQLIRRQDMRLKPLPGFKSLETHHCVTGSMRHIYLYNHHDLSEDMLLGIGAGVSFSYWHYQGQPPFMGGRGNVGAPGQEGLEKTAGRRTGVVVETFRTGSATKAEKTLLDMLAGGQPMMLMLDMGYLPYFDFGGVEYHFGGHAVVACGYDPSAQQVLIADRDGLHPVSIDALARARGSKHKPFPPHHQWYTFDFSQKRRPTATEFREAIAEQTRAMLEPPISNIGVKGIHKAARMVPEWPNTMSLEHLKWALFNTYIFICPIGGSGGGLFRYMFSRFLREAGNLIGDDRLADSADEFKRIGDEWEALGERFRTISETANPACHLRECASPLEHLADLEEAAWRRLEKTYVTSDSP
jgi:hypothetical protein